MANKTYLLLVVGGIGIALLTSWFVMPAAPAAVGSENAASDEKAQMAQLRVSSKLREYDPGRAMELHRAIKTRGLPAVNAPKISEAPAQPDAAKNRYDGYLLTALGMPALADAPTENALGREGPRVDLEHDAGKWARASVDLDRDGKWDEKWSIVQGTVRRSVSSRDDANYDKEVHFIGGVWTLPIGTPMPAAASHRDTPAATPGGGQ